MGLSGVIDSQTESAAFTYDNVGRLVTSSQTTNGASAQRRFAYDRYGNRTGVWNAVTGGTQIQSVSLVESSSIPTNQIESVTENSATSDYTYDEAGNVTDDDVNTFVYDAENRLVSVNSGAEQYKYDHQNRRVAKTVGSVTTQYVWEGSQVIAEHAASTGNALVDYIFVGGRMVKKVEGSTTRYIVSDRLSARMMLDEDYDVVGKQSHLPFGEAMAESGEQEKHKFTSYERDSSTGLDYAVNRFYQSVLGRFMSVDPFLDKGFDTIFSIDAKPSQGCQSRSGLNNIKPDIPQSWSRFNYTMNDPTNLIDPLGLDACKECHRAERSACRATKASCHYAVASTGVLASLACLALGPVAYWICLAAVKAAELLAHQSCEEQYFACVVTIPNKCFSQCNRAGGAGGGFMDGGLYNPPDYGSCSEFSSVFSEACWNGDFDLGPQSIEDPGDLQ